LAFTGPLSLASAPNAFAEFDERVSSARPGVLVVRAPLDVHGPIALHAARRLRASGWTPASVASRAGAPLFREAATQLGLSAVPGDPEACADAIVMAASAQRAAIIGPLPHEGTWDRAVALELARSARALSSASPALRSGALFVFVTGEELPPWESESFDLASELGATDRLRWLSAVAEEAHDALAATDLRSLEAWWSKARRIAPEAERSFDGIGAPARRLLGFIALAGRSLPAGVLATLASGDDTTAIDELVDLGLASRTADLVSACPSCELAAFEASAPPEARRAVAAALTNGGVEPDPGLMRAPVSFSCPSTRSTKPTRRSRRRCARAPIRRSTPRSLRAGSKRWPRSPPRAGSPFG
jgi:hypothetical protein